MMSSGCLPSIQHYLFLQVPHGMLLSHLIFRRWHSEHVSLALWLFEEPLSSSIVDQWLAFERERHISHQRTISIKSMVRVSQLSVLTLALEQEMLFLVLLLMDVKVLASALMKTEWKGWNEGEQFGARPPKPLQPMRQANIKVIVQCTADYLRASSNQLCPIRCHQ
jgi:hypothetical protein